MFVYVYVDMEQLFQLFIFKILICTFSLIHITMVLSKAICMLGKRQNTAVFTAPKVLSVAMLYLFEFIKL